MEGKTPPPSIMVTRHTPRVSENVRPRDPSLDSPHFRQQVKKIKMEKDSTPQRPASKCLDIAEEYIVEFDRISVKLFIN